MATNIRTVTVPMIVPIIGQLNSTGSGAASESGADLVPPVSVLAYARDESYILDNDEKEPGSGVAAAAAGAAGAAAGGVGATTGGAGGAAAGVAVGGGSGVFGGVVNRNVITSFLAVP